MTSKNREKTLADYLRMLRRGLPIIVAIGVVCAAVAVAVSLVQTPTYQAESSLSVQDPNQALALAGGGSFSTQTQLQLALSYAPQVTRQQVLRAVKRELRTPLSPQALRRSVSVSVDPNSALVDVTASYNQASEAAAIANAVAKQDASITTAQVRHQYARQAAQLSRRLRAGTSANYSATKLVYATQLTRLQTLSSVATPLQVNSVAGVPSTPSSPQPLRNGLAALVFGLLVGVAVVYARELFDRRLRQPSDVEQALGDPVVGHIRAEAFGHIGAHARGSLNGMSPLAAADEDSFRVLRQNVRYFTAEPLRTLLVTSPGAREGKSTVAVCLAAANVMSGQRTLLVECDLRRPSLSERLGLPRGPGLTDYLTGNARPAEIVQSVPTVRLGTNGLSGGDRAAPIFTDDQQLVCISAGRAAPQPAELLGSDAFRSFLSEVSQAYENVIIDSAPLLSVADTLEIVPHASAILLCVRLRQTTRDLLRAGQAALNRLPTRPVGVVITGLQQPDVGYYGYDYSYYGAAEVARR